MESKTEGVDFKEMKDTVSVEEILGHYGLLKDLKSKRVPQFVKVDLSWSDLYKLGCWLQRKK